MVLRQLYRVLASAMLSSGGFDGGRKRGGLGGPTSSLRLAADLAVARARGLSDNTKSFSVAVFYGLCSVSMNFLNKAVVSSYEFNHPFFIMTCQVREQLLCIFQYIFCHL